MSSEKEMLGGVLLCVSKSLPEAREAEIHTSDHTDVLESSLYLYFLYLVAEIKLMVELHHPNIFYPLIDKT